MGIAFIFFVLGSSSQNEDQLKVSDSYCTEEVYLSRPIQVCRLRISTCTIQNNNKSLNILPGRGHRRFDLWTNTCSSGSRLQVTGKVQEMHARNNCFSNYSLFPVKLVNLGGHDGAAQPSKFIYFQGKSQEFKAD